MPFNANKITAFVLELPRYIKRLTVLSVDACLCILATWLAYYLRLGEFIPITGPAALPATVSIVIALSIFVISGLYRAIFRYAGWPALVTIFKAVAFYGIIYATIFTAIGITSIPRTVGLIQPILLLLFVGSSRIIARHWLSSSYKGKIRLLALPKVLIYGANASGRQLAAAMANSHEMRIVGFCDDDANLHGQVLNGLPIYNPEHIERIVAVHDIHTVLLALDSISRNKRNHIIDTMRNAKVAVRTLPSVTELAQGKVSISDLRELDIDDLLGRDPVAPNAVLLGKNLTDKVVLVTGAGGSIGSELCRQILTAKPSQLLLIEQSEFALYKIHHELSAYLQNQPDDKTRLIPLLASVCDRKRMHEIMSTWRPHTIYHAAAYKHVPLVEHNPVEGIKNNLFGTYIVAQTAIDNDVGNFVLISTDKAVRPTNIMGTSKRLAEMVLQALAQLSTKVNFSMVRFGNVLGSSGSVVPMFRQQIRDGGPITLTHSDITRYFMTIPEAAQLVIQAGAMAEGGDVFVLDMGEPVRIYDLALRMIELSGLSLKDNMHPDGDIEIRTVGLRPGEKLYEELLIGNNPQPTAHKLIMKAHEDFLSWPQLEKALDSLQYALDSNNIDQLVAQLQTLVNDYTPNDTIVDWVYMASSDTHNAKPH